MSVCQPVLDLLNEAIKQFGAYALHDKGPQEVMDMDEVESHMRESGVQGALDTLIALQAYPEGEPLFEDLFTSQIENEEWPELADAWQAYSVREVNRIVEATTQEDHMTEEIKQEWCQDDLLRPIVRELTFAYDKLRRICVDYEDGINNGMDSVAAVKLAFEIRRVITELDKTSKVTAMRAVAITRERRQVIASLVFDGRISELSGEEQQYVKDVLRGKPS